MSAMRNTRWKDLMKNPNPNPNPNTVFVKQTFIAPLDEVLVAGRGDVVYIPPFPSRV